MDKRDIEDQTDSSALEAQRQHLQDLMFSSVDDLMFIKDSEFRIAQANPAFLALYPKEKQDQIIGYTTFEDYPEAQMKEFVAEDQKALDEGYSEIQETIDFPNGDQKILLTRKIGFNDLNGERYIFGISRDITAIKETESALANANKELEEFAYRVSHDLRSPLISSIELLNRATKAFEKESTAEAKNLIKIAQNSLSSLENLAKDILSVHQLRRGEVKKERIDIEFEILDIWARLQPDEDKVRLDLHCNCEHDVLCDRYGLVQAVENLISNTIKYRSEEQQDCYAIVRVTSDSKSITVTVEDNGIGIPDRNKHQVFDMFQRFHPRHAQGSGLGLYMVNQWVSRVGGKIELEHLNPGTRFTIELPQGNLNS